MDTEHRPPRAGNPDVEALVYIAAFAPDVGDTLGGLAAMNPGSRLGPDALLFRPHPSGLDVYIAPTSYRTVFAGDLTERVAAALAAGQRPIDAAVLDEVSGSPAWATIRSFYMVTEDDHAIPPVRPPEQPEPDRSHDVNDITEHTTGAGLPRRRRARCVSGHDPDGARVRSVAVVEDDRR